MRKTTLIVIAVAVMALLAPLAGQARSESSRVVVVKIREVADGAPASGCLFVLAFPLVSPSGTPLGDGTACITDGDFVCFPIAFAGCRQTVFSTFRFNLAGGSIEAPMTLEEIYTSESSLVQIGRGAISFGDGTFNGATGRIAGGGPLAFTATGAQANLTYVVHVRN